MNHMVGKKPMYMQGNCAFASWIRFFFLGFMRYPYGTHIDCGYVGS